MTDWSRDLEHWDDDFDEADSGTDRGDPAQNLWDDTGHHGELWLDGDGDWIDWGSERDPDHRTRKPVPNDTPVYCACGWPLAIRWSWKQCEFEEPQWRTTDPEMEDALDADPLLYRIAPWLWRFCRCNGCIDLRRAPGHPPSKCDRCRRMDRNDWRRKRYTIVTTISATERQFSYL